MLLFYFTFYFSLLFSIFSCLIWNFINKSFSFDIKKTWQILFTLSVFMVKPKIYSCLITSQLYLFIYLPIFLILECSECHLNILFVFSRYSLIFKVLDQLLLFLFFISQSLPEIASYLYSFYVYSFHLCS